MRITLLLLLALTTASSCGTGRPPPASEPAGAADEHRQLRAAIERLEQKLEELAARLDRQPGQSPAPSRGLSIDDRLERLAQRQAELEADVAKARGAATPTARTPDRARPDPGTVYAVKVDGSPARGRKDAPVVMVRSFEFACPFSHKSLPAMEELLKQYPDDLRIVYRNFVVHPQIATAPARAACAAHRQGKFNQMHDLIWTRGFEANRNLGMDNMEKLAGEIGLDLKRFVADADGACIETIRDDQADLAAIGQAGTPSFWINGRFLSGARPVEQFKEIIDQELAEARKHIGKRGITRANYYKKVVLKKGKKKL